MCFSCAGKILTFNTVKVVVTVATGMLKQSQALMTEEYDAIAADSAAASPRFFFVAAAGAKVVTTAVVVVVVAVL